MRFHLSTLLLAMVIVALGLGWYLDHNDPRRTEIAGTWQTPRDDPFFNIGFYTILEIRENGSFQRSEIADGITTIYTGTYRREQDGTVMFHVTWKSTDLSAWLDYHSKQLDGILPELPPSVKLDIHFPVRCALDQAGLLMTHGDFPLFRSEADREASKQNWNAVYERARSHTP